MAEINRRVLSVSVGLKFRLALSYFCILIENCGALCNQFEAVFSSPKCVDLCLYVSFPVEEKKEEKKEESEESDEDMGFGLFD